MHVKQPSESSEEKIAVNETICKNIKVPLLKEINKTENNTPDKKKGLDNPIFVIEVYNGSNDQENNGRVTDKETINSVGIHHRKNDANSINIRCASAAARWNSLEDPHHFLSK